MSFDTEPVELGESGGRSACQDCLKKGLGIGYHKGGICNKHHQKQAIEKAKKKDSPAYWQRLGIYKNMKGRKHDPADYSHEHCRWCIAFDVDPKSNYGRNHKASLCARRRNGPIQKILGVDYLTMLFNTVTVIGFEYKK